MCFWWETWECREKDKRWPHNRKHPDAVSLSHIYSTHTHTQEWPTALCVSCRTYKQEAGCLSFLGSVNILNKNKFLLSEKGETHTVGAAALSLRRGLWCPSDRADNEGPLHLNSFNWRVDVTGCWYLVVSVLAPCEPRRNFKDIIILIFKLWVESQSNLFKQMETDAPPVAHDKITALSAFVWKTTLNILFFWLTTNWNPITNCTSQYFLTQP